MRSSVVLLSALLLWSCSDADSDPAAGSVQGSAAQASLVPRSPPAEERLRASEPSIAPPSLSALSWLPADTILALRVPSLSAAREAWRGTAVHEAARRLPLAELKEHWAPLLGMAEASLKAALPEAEAVLDTLLGLGGEVVVAVPAVEPLAFVTRQGTPFSLAAFAELGPAESQVRELLPKLARSTGGSMLEHSVARWTLPEAQIDAAVRGGHLCLSFGPASGDASRIDELCRTSPTESFLRTELCSSALADVPGTGWIETFVHLDPVWKLSAALGGSEVTDALSALGLPSVSGISLVGAIDQESCFDRVRLHTSGAQDLFTATLAKATLDESFLRLVPSGAETVFAQALDLPGLLDELLQRLPEEPRGQLAFATSMPHPRFGTSVVDLLATLGTQSFVATRGELPLSPDDASDFEACVGIELRDVERAETLTMRIASTFGVDVRSGVHPGSGFRCRFLDLPEGTAPFPLQPAWTILDHTLVIATTPQALSRSFQAHKTGKYLGPPSLCSHFAEGARPFFVQYQSTAAKARSLAQMLGSVAGVAGRNLSGPPSGEPSFAPLIADLSQLAALPSDVLGDFAARLPNTDSTARVDEHGIVVESTSPWGASWVGVAGVAVAASIALPNLLSARQSANEAAAVATLRNLCSAQAQMQAIGAIDLDRDGMGEYASFAELSGGAPLRGRDRPLVPPLLSSAFQDVQQGVVIRNGYVFRMQLPGADGAAVLEDATGGMAGELSADGCELSFAVYAWPVQFASTGARAFYVDEEGDVWATDNQRERQRYSGIEHAPEPRAAVPLGQATFGEQRLGGDGGFWQRVR